MSVPEKLEFGVYLITLLVKEPKTPSEGFPTIEYVKPSPSTSVADEDKVISKVVASSSVVAADLFIV